MCMRLTVVFRDEALCLTICVPVCVPMLVA